MIYSVALGYFLEVSGLPVSIEGRFVSSKKRKYTLAPLLSFDFL
jgi:hypothetical protein